MMPVRTETVGRYKYFSVEKIGSSASGKTGIYDVVTHSGSVIGRIGWYPGWRQYVLNPAEGSFWSSGCLADIQDCLKMLNKR